MVSVIFIDYLSLLDNANSLMPASTFALKDVVSHINDINIVCINTKQDMMSFCYDNKIDVLSQALSIKKTCFEALNVESKDDLLDEIHRWMSKHSIKSFAFVMNGANHRDECMIVGKAYPNNVICCDVFSDATAKDTSWMLSNFSHVLSDESRIFFTSDTHFGHKNIIKYCNRPWNSGKNDAGEAIVTDEDVLAMDNEIIRRWNEVVMPNDVVWHLGDFSLGGKHVAEQVFPQLNGKINLVMGNHDHYKLKWYYDLGFNRVYDKKVIIQDFIVLTHVPLMFLNSNCPFFQIFGHVHDSDAYQTWSKIGCCVCVERHDYYPVSWKLIKKKYDEMNNRNEDDA